MRPTLPDGQNDIWVTGIDRAQQLVADETRHSIDQTGAVAEVLLEQISVFGVDEDTIGSCDHTNFS
jgi:hypothetical protein